ncbi:hypothetical protein BH09MYX1_BH09MYX1_41520 [soil metagenome]
MEATDATSMPVAIARQCFRMRIIMGVLAARRQSVTAGATFLSTQAVYSPGQGVPSLSGAGIVATPFFRNVSRKHPY